MTRFDGYFRQLPEDEGELRIVCHLGMGAVGGGGVPRWIVALEEIEGHDDDTQLQYMTHIEKFSVLEVERELVRNSG